MKGEYNISIYVGMKCHMRRGIINKQWIRSCLDMKWQTLYVKYIRAQDIIWKGPMRLHESEGWGSRKSTCAPMKTYVYHFMVAKKWGTIDKVAYQWHVN